MNDVTDELPAVTGCSSPAIPAPQVRQLRPNYCPPPCQPAPEDEGRAAAALAELDRALAEHGAPDPERTAAWLAAGAPVRP